MFKGRIWPIIAVAVGLILIFLICRASPLLQQSGQKTNTLPVDLQNVIPSSWTLLPDQPEICDYDQDGEDEWLILFRYDTTDVEVPFAATGTTEPRGPIGGVIYDAQVNYVPQDPGNRSPYRPALLVPYMLLPDFFPGKGQGYLGETTVTRAQYSASKQQSGKCAIDEIYVLGYADSSSLPSRLSAFRWRGKATGYIVAHFAGNARIAADLPTDGTKPLEQVTTYDRLGNHRSLLCEAKRFERQGEQAELNFSEVSSAYTIDFCFNPPNDPYYPEGVVVALLRGKVPTNTQNMPAPIGESYLMGGVPLPPELGNPSETPVRILSVVNQGAVETQPAQGRPCPQQSVPAPATAAADSTPSVTWWCGSEEAEVLTEVVAATEAYRVRWRLISVANDQVNADTHWRVSEVELY